MDSITEGTEQLYLEYIRENGSFLKAFHRVYYMKYKEYLKGYSLSEYMITSYIRANKIEEYNNYDEFIGEYLWQLSEDEGEAGEIYNSYYGCFIENMSEDIDRLKEKYNKTDEDIFIAYEIKTVFQFYAGFLMEKILMYHLDNYSCYTVLKKGLEHKRYMDDKYAIDIEAVGDTGQIIAIQCKSYTYLNISEEKKWIHINKHEKYKVVYGKSDTYYMLHKDYKPCYYIEGGKKHYWIRSEKVLDLDSNKVYVGTFEEMIEQMKGEMKCKRK